MFPGSICSTARRCISSHLKSFHSSATRQSFGATQMNWSATVLTSATSDTDPSVLVTFNDAKYLFNAGESLTRAWAHGNRGWKKISAVFVTSATSQRANGLPVAFCPCSARCAG
ncbi:uncharacterized protein B0H18DRAFT_1012649 [Fomitopsis serialis]|uniref:uncharacterized protein n=1 Tax=Fomitopsis serialis TaxID=139415 RepID=UPI002008CFCC|nr:uncharacterized protein B0H18DRAFT_1012649 [Neoantrodia serialis]KAH9924164.1 hypothetical protein B0H18DRAFT_1012649 [Neoantrodia serialis]